MKKIQNLMSILLVVGLCIIGFAGNAQAAEIAQADEFPMLCLIANNHPCQFQFDSPQTIFYGTFENQSTPGCYIDVSPQGWQPQYFQIGAGQYLNTQFFNPDGASFIEFSTYGPCGIEVSGN